MQAIDGTRFRVSPSLRTEEWMEEEEGTVPDEITSPEYPSDLSEEEEEVTPDY